MFSFSPSVRPSSGDRGCGKPLSVLLAGCLRGHIQPEPAVSRHCCSYLPGLHPGLYHRNRRVSQSNRASGRAGVLSAHAGPKQCCLFRADHHVGQWAAAGGDLHFFAADGDAGANAAPTTLTIQTAKAMAREGREGLGGIALALLLLPFASARRLRRAARHRALLGLVAGLLLSGLLALAGCATGGLFGNTPNTYTITVTGTSGSLSHSTTIQLTEE